MKIQTIIEKYIGGYSHVEQGNQHMYHCPSCNWKNPRLSVNYDENKFKCWKCGFSSLGLISLLYFVKASTLDIEEFKQAQNIKKKFSFKDLNASGETTLPTLKNRIKQKIDNKLSKKRKVYPFWNEKENIKIFDNLDTFQGIQAYNLLLEREVSDFEIEFYDIRFNPSTNKIVFPSRDLDSRVDFYVTRSVDFSFYSNVDEIKKTDVIFNSNLLNMKDSLYIVEGIFDALKIGYNAVPVLGTKIHTLLKKQIIRNRTPKVTIIFDDDAHDSMISELDYFYDLGVNVYFIDLNQTPFQDLGDVPKSNLHDVLKLEQKYKKKKLINL